MKLYDVPRNSWVRPVLDNPTAPPDARLIKLGETVKFHNIDGMYSYCHDKEGNVVHLPAWQEVEIVNPENENSSTNL